MSADPSQPPRAQEEERRTPSAAAASEAFLEGLSSALLVLGRDFRIQRVNQHTANWVGCKPEEMVGQLCYRLLHQRDGQCDDCPVALAFATGEPATVTHTGLDAQGRPTHAEIIAVPIRDATGQVVAALESARDVTERERQVDALADTVRRLEASQEELRRRNEELVRLNGLLGRATSDMGVAAVVQQLLGGALQVVDPEASGAIFLLDEGGRRLDQVATLGLAGAFSTCEQSVRVGECLCGQAAAQDQVVIRRSDPAACGAAGAAPATGHASIAIPLTASDRVLGVLTIHLPPGREPPPGGERIYELLGRQLGMTIDNARLYERTDAQLHRKVVELTSALEAVEQERARAQASEQAKQEFVTMLSHDLRSPLSVILSDASEHGRTCRDEACRSSRSSVRASVRRANAMLSAVVDSARLEGGVLDLQREPLDLAALLRDFAGGAVAAPDRPRVRLSLPGEPTIVLGDRVWLERAAANVLGNALKFSGPDGPVEVRLQAEGGSLRLEVADLGPGIPPGELPMLFKRFYRASNAHRTQGSGLGLYITRLVVEAHGGQVAVRSELGHGATVTLTLPRA